MCIFSLFPLPTFLTLTKPDFKPLKRPLRTDPDSFFICRSDRSSSANYGNLWHCIIMFLLNSVFRPFTACFHLLPFLGRLNCVHFISLHLFSTSYSQEFQPNLLCLLISRSSLNFQEIWYSWTPRSPPPAGRNLLGRSAPTLTQPCLVFSPPFYWSMRDKI